MINQCNRVDALNQIMLEDPSENTYTILAHTIEELGEFSTAVCIEDGSKVKGYKKLDESSVSEAVDALICVLSLYYSRGGRTEDLPKLINKKLDKWQKKMIKKEEDKK
jgi:NTP pyrophosphatase (non-canonical NTP hydrolase)